MWFYRIVNSHIGTCTIKTKTNYILSILASESHLKVMKNDFYFTWKVLFSLEKIKFLPWFFGHIKNGFIRKITLISKFTKIQPRYILPNISIIKGNQTMKDGQLIECNTSKNIEKWWTYIMVQKIFPDPFLKIKTEHIIL